MQVKHGLSFEIKDVSETGVIEGYASVFDVVDNGGDKVLAGAFKKALAQQKNIKMLWQHDSFAPIGVWNEVLEDEHGLFAKGKLCLDTEKGKEAFALLKAGAIDGLSIGYRTIEADKIDNIRLLKELELWEISVVTFPMNPKGVIDTVKSISEQTNREIERTLTQDAGFSRKEARALMRGGLKELRGKQDAAASSSDAAKLAADFKNFLQELNNA